jgi:hypothetical protein
MQHLWGEKENGCSILVEKSEGRKDVDMVRIILKKDLKNKMGWYGPDSSGLEETVRNFV